jgi:hypothetical protein
VHRHLPALAHVQLVAEALVHEVRNREPNHACAVVSVRVRVCGRVCVCGEMEFDECEVDVWWRWATHPRHMRTPASRYWA